MIIKKITEINNGLLSTTEPIVNYDDFDPKKYNGNLLVSDIMLWLRNFDTNLITIDLDKFIEQTKIDKDIFLTFVNELVKTKRVEFDITIDNNIVTFSGFNKNQNIS